MAKVSVIVPVYKVEAYLERCVLSVLAQTFVDFELILVDDGSPDTCPEMCDRFALTDSRIRVVHKENGGLSSARNAGTELAEGEFIFYLDSDDYLESNALEKLVAVQVETGAELVVGNYYYTYPERENAAAFPCREILALERSGAMALLAEGQIQNFAWGKLIRTELAKKYPFPEGKLFEDHFWAHHILGDAEKTILLPEVLVHYWQRSDSISYSITMKRLDILDGWRERKGYLEEKYPELVSVYMAHVADMFLGLAWLVLTRMRKDRAQAFDMLRDFCQEASLEMYAAKKQRILLNNLKRSVVLYSISAVISAIINRLER